MNDSKNITIVMLLLSAVVLSVLLLASIQTAAPVQAGNTSARFGDYVMAPGARAKSFDNLYVIDVLQKRLNVYSADPNRKRVEILDTVDLAQYFKNQ